MKKHVTESKPLRIEPVPEKLWLFRNRETGKWTGAFDDPPGGEVFMAAFSQSDALANLRHQSNTYDLDCEAVCVSVQATSVEPIRLTRRERLL